MWLSGVAFGFAALSATVSFAGSNEPGANADRSWADEVREGVRESRSAPPSAPGLRESRNPKPETEEERARSSKPVRSR
jgi:hypothetical protein